MKLFGLLNSTVDFLPTISVVMKYGIVISCGIYLFYAPRRRFAGRYRIKPMDPTFFFRRWNGFYTRVFEPHGRSGVQLMSPILDPGLTFYLITAVLGMLVSVGLFAISSSTVIWAVAVLYHTAGTAPDLMPIIEFLAGLASVFGMAVVFHSAEYARIAVEEMDLD